MSYKPDLSTIPLDPGCYLYKDKNGTIIYVGKAKSLKKRVSSYFQKSHKDEKTIKLVADIRDVKIIVTSNEVEALLLENNLIKKHKPKYNIDLKESQRYAYLVMTDEEFPRLVVARHKKIKGKYFGPFVSGEARSHIQKMLQATFQIRTCRKLPKRACLRYHIGLCEAPCTGEVTKEQYNHQVHEAMRFLKGDSTKLAGELKAQMKEFAKKQEYEQAKKRRDQLYAIERLNEKQKVEQEKNIDQDAINYFVHSGKTFLIVFNVEKGMLTSKKEFTLEGEDVLNEFITQYYAENPVPKEIILPRQVDEQIPAYLQALRKTKVRITIPQKGTKKELLQLVKRNVEVTFMERNLMLEDLQKALKMHQLPQVIECFDISHSQGTNTVASMVQFRAGKPDKSNYRRFKIRTAENDDFTSMNEVVTRRYKRLKEENKEFPDLIVIDGGAGQLSAARRALLDLGIRIPIISLAKKLEEIYTPGRPIPLRLPHTRKALKLLMQIRDEAHRFAITYHRLLRSKEMVA